jgi:hypothetical protein
VTADDHSNQPGAPRHRRQCLFCSRSDGGFQSVEHIVSEGLGNTELVLPKGVVCDRCNHGQLALLDDALTSFMPIAVARTAYGIKRKGGGLPTARLGNALIRRVDDTTVHFETKSRRATETRHDGATLNLIGRRLTPRYSQTMARALLKVALECAWLDFGDDVLAPGFDHLRQIVLTGGHPGYLMLLRQGRPEGRRVAIQYKTLRLQRDRVDVAVVADLLGTLMATDSANPAPQGPANPADVIVVPF